MRRLPGDGAPCTQYQRSHGFHCASVGLLENPRRGGSGGHADSEQTHVLRAGSAAAVGGGGRPDYLQKLKVPEGYEKMIDYSNI